MKIIDRYLIYELISPFCFGCAIFVIFFLVTWQILDRLIHLIFEQGASLLVVVKLFFLYLPQCIVLSFPLATLLATLISFGRLSSESEFIAMHASGIALVRIVVPVILVALIVSLITLGANEFLVPTCNRAAKDLFMKVTKAPVNKIEKNIVLRDFEDDKVVKIIYAKEFNRKTKTMYEVTVLDQRSPEKLILSAKKAVWAGGENWIFYDCFIQNISPEGKLRRLKIPQKGQILGKTPEDIKPEERKPEEMNIREFKEYIGRLAEEGMNTKPLLVQLHLKVSLPFASLVFALIGAPLGLKPRRSGTAIGVGLSLVIIFIYYIILNYTRMLGEHGALAPPLAAWLANLLTGIAGLGLIIKSS